jgi:hypothetical protein
MSGFALNLMQLRPKAEKVGAIGAETWRGQGFSAVFPPVRLNLPSQQSTRARRVRHPARRANVE